MNVHPNIPSDSVGLPPATFTVASLALRPLVFAIAVVHPDPTSPRTFAGAWQK